MCVYISGEKITKSKNAPNPRNKNEKKNQFSDALVAASVNYFASFIAGLVIFAVLGYMATIENVSIAEVATEG